MKKLKRKVEQFKWFVYRWQRMVHPHEELYRVKQFLRNTILDRYQQNKNFNFSNLQSGVSFINETQLTTYHVKLADAYTVFQKRIPVNTINWRTDPKTQIASPITFKGNINHKNIAAAGENRYVYELNRLHILPALAVASINGCEECIEQLTGIITSWQKENPYLQSINWKSGIEVGIRGTNLVITRLLLQGSTDTDNINKQIDTLLSYHYTYLKKHLSLFSSANNHLLKELLGLVIISAVYDFKDRKKDLSYYFSYYQDELLKQTYEDGGSKEQSVHYHAAVLNASFLVLHFAATNGLQPRKEFLNRLKCMCIYLDEMTLGGKTESLPGDKDDSNIIYDVFDNQFNLYHSLLTTGKRIFLDVDYRFYKYNSSDLLNTLLYSELYYTAIADTIEHKQSYTYFPHAGYFIFDTLPYNSKLFFDVGELGFGPIAAHGHSDLLHFTLWVDDEPFIVDSGTYQYNPHYQKWREYFRGVTAHNTIAVNHQNHSKSLGVMLWGKLPAVQVTGYGQDNEEHTFCEAEHTAFTNKAGIIKHNRRIVQDLNTIIIEDSITGKGSFQADFYLHFHPLVKPVLAGDKLVLIKGSKQLMIMNEMFEKAVLEFGNETIPLGWYSNKFDQFEGTYTLHLSVNAFDNKSLRTEIKFAE